MLLNFPKNEFKLTEPAQSISVEQQSPFKLTYRGNTFDYTPPFAAETEECIEDWPTVTLSYRGRQYTQKVKPVKPSERNPAINWRGQFA